MKHYPSWLIWALTIAGLIGAAGILVVEKKTKSVQRLLTTNMSKGQILAGHFLAMFVMAPVGAELYAEAGRPDIARQSADSATAMLGPVVYAM